MKAVGFSSFGPPDVLAVVDLPDPEPGPGQVRIRVAAATINPTDILLRSGGRPGVLTGAPPYVAGLELAGVIDAVGEGVDRTPGERVVAMTTSVPDGRGAQAELAVTDARSVARLPEGIAMTAAATLPMNGMTARLALDRLELRPGDSLLVTGAAGAVGGYAAELAAGEGIEVIAVARAGDEEGVLGFGTTHFIPADRELGPAVREIFPDGVDAAVDGAVSGAAILPALREGARLVPLRPFEGTTERGIVVDQIQVREYLLEGEKLQALVDLVAAGRLSLRVSEVFAPEQAVEAFRLAEADGRRGRVVLDFS